MVEVREFAWLTREEIERDLLPFVKPAAKDVDEREVLLVGLLALYKQCFDLNLRGHTTSWLEGPGKLHAKMDRKNILKAADLLVETMLDFDVIVKELRERAEAYKPWKTLSQGNRKATECVWLCSEFLTAHKKHAGTKETGLAVKLAQAIWEISTWDHHTGEGESPTASALSNNFSRHRGGGKKAKKK